MPFGLGLALKNTSLGAGGPPVPSTFATGVLSWDGNATEGETITIGGMTYRFVAGVQEDFNDVIIASTASGTNVNLIEAVNLTHPDVTAMEAPGKMNVEAVVAGAAGNDIVTTSTSLTATWGASTLQGGG